MQSHYLVPPTLRTLSSYDEDETNTYRPRHIHYYQHTQLQKQMKKWRAQGCVFLPPLLQSPIRASSNKHAGSRNRLQLTVVHKRTTKRRPGVLFCRYDWSFCNVMPSKTTPRTHLNEVDHATVSKSPPRRTRTRLTMLLKSPQVAPEVDHAIKITPKTHLNRLIMLRYQNHDEDAPGRG